MWARSPAGRVLRRIVLRVGDIGASKLGPPCCRPAQAVALPRQLSESPDSQEPVQVSVIKDLGVITANRRCPDLGKFP